MALLESRSVAGRDGGVADGSLFSVAVARSVRGAFAVLGVDDVSARG
jgi:hypothetical protein